MSQRSLFNHAPGNIFYEAIRALNPKSPNATRFNAGPGFTFPDNEHPIDEERFINIGFSAAGRVLVLIYTERLGKIRIISCRKATADERRFYEEGSH